MKPRNLNWEQINRDPESAYLHSKHIVHFVLFSVKNLARDLQDCLQSQGQF